jgi:hypothetical protein
MSNKTKLNILPCGGHDFRYSHIEYPQAGTYSSIPKNKDVIICRKCGLIMRQEIIN